MSKLRNVFIVFIACFVNFSIGQSAEKVNKKVFSKFQFLPVGEVKPQGWLLQQMLADVQNGFTPVLDRLTPDYCRLATFDTRNKTDYEVPKIGEVWWAGETTGNWLDGFIRMAYLTDDAKAKARVDEIVLQIMAMQEADGYLGTYPKGLRYQSPLGLPNNGELWAQACLFRGLLAYYELTGKKEIFTAVKRAIDLTISKYSKDRPYWPETVTRGGPPHSLMFVDVCEYMQRLTGDKRYINFAQFLYDGYNAANSVFDADILTRNLIQQDKLFNGHAAHTMEHLRV
ncbi:MAG: beta-L-arabinofuranosidase domain-containing protein, partial [Paludibacter sp.]